MNSIVTLVPVALFFIRYLATSATDEQSVWGKMIPELLDRVGFPVAVVLAICYGIVKVVKWFAPKVDAWIEASKKRQEVMAEEYKKTTALFSELSTETRKMQQTNTETLMALEIALQKVCQYRCTLPHQNCPTMTQQPGGPE